MRNQNLHTILAALVVCMLLVSCGESSDSDSQQTLAPPPPILGGGTTPATTTQTPAATNAANSTSTVLLRDSTPQEAFQTFVDRLKAYDIAGAAQLCDPDDPNTKGIIKIATGMQHAASDNATAGKAMSAETLASMVLGGIDAVTFEIAEQTDDTATAHITAPKDKTYEMVRLDAGWRIRIADDTAPFPHQ